MVAFLFKERNFGRVFGVEEAGLSPTDFCLKSSVEYKSSLQSQLLSFVVRILISHYTVIINNYYTVIINNGTR